jgi:plasmid replication initiation protein
MSNRQIIKQDFSLINAKYKLNTNEIKIILNAISEIKIEDKEFHTYRMKLSNISQELHNQSMGRSYTRIKNFCESLLKKPLSIKKDNGFLVVNWFASLEYIAGSAEIEYEISPKLKPYLLELKERFVQYNLKYILPLASNYSIRIYQLLKEYEKLKKRTFTVDELREILQVPNSYLYADFKRKIIKVAEKELLEHCDIYFKFEEIKDGKKVDEILFKIIKKGEQQKTEDNLKSEHSFIAYMRKNFINQDILEAVDANSKEKMLISVSEKGILYDKFGKEFNASRSKEIWASLYQMAKEDKLFCFKQKSLF